MGPTATRRGAANKRTAAVRDKTIGRKRGSSFGEKNSHRDRPTEQRDAIPLFQGISTELCKNIHAKFQELLLNCSAAHPKITLSHSISTSHSQNLAGMFLLYSVAALLTDRSTVSNSIMSFESHLGNGSAHWHDP